MSYAMISRPALEDFQTQLAVGVKRPALAPDAFRSSPQGAFDAMPEGLSERVTKGLDQLSDDAARRVHSYLSRRFAHDDDDPDAEQESNGGALGARICDLLESANVDPGIVDSVRELLAAGNGDGDLILRHKGDQDPSGGPSSGYDPMNRSAGTMVGADEPPPFAGSPRVGGGQVPISDRRAARDMARFGKVADQAGHVSYIKDVPPPREPKPMAQDSRSRAAFLERFPMAARIGFR
jgi:hypothetical protein